MDDPIHDEYILTVVEPYFGLTKEFRETSKPFFKISRILWLHCHRYGLQIPQDALKAFTQGIEKQVNNIEEVKKDLSVLIGEFEKKPTYKTAKILWLHCQYNDLPTPQDAIDKFAQDIGKQIKSYPLEKRFKEKLRDQTVKHEEHLENFKKVDDIIKADPSLGVQAAVGKIADENGKNWQTIEKAYYRAKEHIEEREECLKEHEIKLNKFLDANKDWKELVEYLYKKD